MRVVRAVRAVRAGRKSADLPGKLVINDVTLVVQHAQHAISVSAVVGFKLSENSIPQETHLIVFNANLLGGNGCTHKSLGGGFGGETERQKDVRG